MVLAWGGLLHFSYHGDRPLAMQGNHSNFRQSSVISTMHHPLCMQFCLLAWAAVLLVLAEPLVKLLRLVIKRTHASFVSDLSGCIQNIKTFRMRGVRELSFVLHVVKN